MTTTPQAWPDWYDGRHINEVLFCQQFLDKHPMKCVRGRLFTVDGLIEDEGQIGNLILEEISGAQNVQIVFRLIELVTGFHEPCMNRLVRRLRRIPHLPVPQYTGVIRQNRKAQPLVFHELLCFCSDMLCVERRCAGRIVRTKVKVCCQTLRRLIEQQAEQLCGKVDHISMLPAGEAIIVIVRHIQAGMPVIVERAACHTVMVDLHAVPLCCLPAAYAIFDVLKTIHALSSVK